LISQGGGGHFDRQSERHFDVLILVNGKMSQTRLRPAQFDLVSRKMRFTYCANVAENFSATLKRMMSAVMLCLPPFLLGLLLLAQSGVHTAFHLP
jgi:hypothetical protein